MLLTSSLTEISFLIHRLNAVERAWSINALLIFWNLTRHYIKFKQVKHLWLKEQRSSNVSVVKHQHCAFVSQLRDCLVLFWALNICDQIPLNEWKGIVFLWLSSITWNYFTHLNKINSARLVFSTHPSLHHDGETGDKPTHYTGTNWETHRNALFVEALF